MKNKIILFLALAVSFAFVAQAVTLNLSILLTDREVKGITLATQQINQIRTNQVPPLPAYTQAQYAEKILRDTLSYLADKAIEKERADRAAKYEAASAAKQAASDAALD